MKSFLTRFFLAVTLLCGTLCFVAEDGVQNAACRVPEGGTIPAGVPLAADGFRERVSEDDGWPGQVAEEPQDIAEAVLRTAPSSHRIASSRHTRLLSPHGGRTGQHHGRTAADESLNPCNYRSPLRCFGIVGLHGASSSPRLYYVIALRRILC